MNDSKLIQLLKTFSKEEWKEFEKFTASPYFNNGRNYIPLLSELKKFYPPFDSLNLTKENLYNSLFPGKEFKATVIFTLASGLYKLAEQFLKIKGFEKDSFAGQKYLLEEFSSRKLDKLFEKELEHTNQILDEYKLNTDHIFYKYEISKISNNFIMFRFKELNEIFDLQNETNLFVTYVISSSLKHYSDLLTTEGIYKKSFENNFYRNLFNYVGKNKTLFQNSPLIEIHFLECMLNIYNREEDFDTLKNLKDKCVEILEEVCLYNLYIHLNNYCVRMRRLGNNKFEIAEFSLEKEMLELKLHDKMDYISFTFFSSTAVNAINLGEYDWAYSFIQKYKSKLNPLQADFILEYLDGFLSFKKKDYSEALEHLSIINIEHTKYKQRVKELRIKIYYETNSFDPAISLIETSFKTLKRDNQIPDKRKKHFLYFLKYIRKLIFLRLNPDKTNTILLEKELLNEEFFIAKDWILEKISEL